MELIIDNFFKESYERYFDSFKHEYVVDMINAVFEKWEPELLNETVNIIKTAMTLNLTYTECYDKVAAAILHKFPIQSDIDKFILSVTLKVMISVDEDSVSDFMSKPRDIYKEVTAKHFRVPLDKVTDEMVAQMKDASDRFTEQSYSITDPAVDGWDDYFYNVCRQVARNSKCLSRRIGAVMVKDKSIVSTGYNGPPRGVPRCDLRWTLDPGFIEKYGHHAEGKEVEGKCPRYVIGFNSGEGLEICPAGHAERNALINAARYGISTIGTTLYMTCGIPCSPCLIEIINAGVKEIVVTSLQIYDETSTYLLNQGSLVVRMYDFIK
jgi:dCMP deaminase